MMVDAAWQTAAAVALLAALVGCEKPRPVDWMQITQGTGADGAVFYLDRTNLTVKAGTPYIILQTRYADGRIGSIRAEVNCPRQMIEPTALKEAVSKDGALVASRTTNLGADEERALLKYACAQR